MGVDPISSRLKKSQSAAPISCIDCPPGWHKLSTYRLAIDPANAHYRLSSEVLQSNAGTLYLPADDGSTKTRQLRNENPMASGHGSRGCQPEFGVGHSRRQAEAAGALSAEAAARFQMAFRAPF